MKVKQIYNVLNDAMKQVFGEENVKEENLTGLVNLGNTLISQSDDSKIYDNLYNSLLDRVYKVVLSQKKYTPQLNNILTEYETYGAILEKIYIAPKTANENNSWKLENGKSYDPFKVTLDDIRVKLFSDRTTWEIPYTVTDNMIKSAFLSESEMGKFVQMIYLNAENSLEAQIEAVEQWTVANFIASKYNYSISENSTGIHVINLLTDYKKLHSDSTLTSTTAMYDKEFLRYCALVIKKYSKKFSRFSTVFNTENYKRFTNDDDLRITFINDFVSALEVNLESDTFHDSFVSLPNYHPVAYWQGSGVDYSTDECMKINITTSDGTATELDNVIGYMADANALGVTIWNKRTTSQYNGHGEYNNYWLKADIGLFNDLSENGLIFRIA